MTKNLLTSIKWQFIFAIGALRALSAQLENDIQERGRLNDFRQLNSEVFLVRLRRNFCMKTYKKPCMTLASARKQLMQGRQVYYNIW